MRPVQREPARCDRLSGSLLDPGAPRQDDQVGERDPLPAGLGAVELRLNFLQGLQRLVELGRVVYLQSICGARRMRAPFAPPRLSVPRYDAADAQAVETSRKTDNPEAKTFALRSPISCSPTNS